MTTEIAHVDLVIQDAVRDLGELEDKKRAVATAGDPEAGCTVHIVTGDLDDGPILGQARVPVLSDDTPETLAARVLEQEHILYPRVLRRFASGDLTPVILPETA